MGLTKSHRAGAVIAFAAALFFAGEPQVLTQPLQLRACGWYIAGIDPFAPSGEADGFDGMLNGRRGEIHADQVITKGPCAA
ncbi:hypothetical protein IWX87_000125 [Polaromonas sp. CG_9.7]|nr:hypothetical protein [Polaromonas sp. CG_9.7]MBG6112383.1 hypothetical protein [Polaromonas sp. CG_9.2]MDH6184030.1 hypothetical protein [Polaromonas sp. CG_23.6]